MRDIRTTRREVLGTLATIAWLGGCRRKTEPDSCEDVTGLDDGALMGRALQRYVDRATSQDKQCSGCDFWLAASEVTACGRCRLLPGPIHPRGTCAAFVPKQ